VKILIKTFNTGPPIITRPPPNPSPIHKSSAPFQSLDTLIWFSIPTLPIFITTLSAGGPSLPPRPFPSTSVAGCGTTTSPTTTTDRVAPSPTGIDSRPFPPQSPFAPSSLGDRRLLASAEGASGGLPNLRVYQIESMASSVRLFFAMINSSNAPIFK
jgi:hypothetical protein